MNTKLNTKQKHCIGSGNGYTMATDVVLVVVVLGVVVAIRFSIP